MKLALSVVGTYLLVFLIGIVGYIHNIIHLIVITHQTNPAIWDTVLSALGVLAIPLGAVYGWVTLL